MSLWLNYIVIMPLFIEISFVLGAVVDGKLVGVVQVGRPVSRNLDDGKTVEVVRLCTDGTKDVCSFLYAKAARIAKEMGYEKIITYILESENGTSLKAAGWKQEFVTKGGEWNRKSRPRNTTAPTVPKKRYGKNLIEKRTSFHLDSPMVSDAGLHCKNIEEVFK